MNSSMNFNLDALGITWKQIFEGEDQGIALYWLMLQATQSQHWHEKLKVTWPEYFQGIYSVYLDGPQVETEELPCKSRHH